MERLTWAQKYSKRTTGIYVRMTKTVVLGHGFLILALLTGLAIPRFTGAYVWAWVVMALIFAGALVCMVVVCAMLVPFYASARVDRQRRRAGLPLDRADAQPGPAPAGR
ncbi:hypothetical protein [Sinomonas soli]